MFWLFLRLEIQRYQYFVSGIIIITAINYFIVIVELSSGFQDDTFHFRFYVQITHLQLLPHCNIYTNPAQMPAQKTTPQMFQTFQSTTQNDAAQLYFDIRECNKLQCTDSVLIRLLQLRKRSRFFLLLDWQLLMTTWWHSMANMHKAKCFWYFLLQY